MASGEKMTRNDAINWLITKLNKDKKVIPLHFLQSFVCQLNSECTQCPLFIEIVDNVIECEKVKEN